MPHSITGKHRSKRPDNRPNAKKRKEDRLAAYAAAEAKDVISTRIPKSEQKERPVTGELRQKVLPPEVKRARFLQKLLRQIEALKERKEAGEQLDTAQLQKLGRRDEVVAEIEELLDVNLDSSDEEEDENDGDDHEAEKQGKDSHQKPMKK